MRTDIGEDQSSNRNLSFTVNSRLAAFALWATIASIVVTTISVGITYWAQGEPEARVNFETISDTNVFDLHRPLKDLSIIFRGHDVQEQNLNLRIVIVNVTNTGEQDILPIHYDPEDGWGMQFSDGEVIESRLVDSNSAYLRSKIVPQVTNENVVSFPKVIFETGSSFAVEVLLLHPKDISPYISPVGKIAGINEITVSARPLSQEDVSFFAGLFPGSALTQAVRTIIYLPGSLFAIVLIIFALIGTSIILDKLGAWARRRRVFKTRTILLMDQARIRNFLIDHYSLSGTTGLLWLKDMISQPSTITWLNSSSTWTTSLHSQEDGPEAPILFLDEVNWSEKRRALSALNESELIQRGGDDRAIIDPALGQAVDDLLAELGG